MIKPIKHILKGMPTGFYYPSEVDPYIKHLEQRAEAVEAKLAELAAENVALTSACRLLAEECAETAGEAEITMQSIKTPATNAWLNSVRAEGVEMLADKFTAIKTLATGHIANEMRAFAAMLRNIEEQSK